MSEKNSQIPQLSTEGDLKNIASYSERRDFVRSRFDKDYTGTTKENEALLRNSEFKKIYLEQFSRIRNTSRDARMNLLSDRPDKNSKSEGIFLW
jgi:hypothetical protein